MVKYEPFYVVQPKDFHSNNTGMANWAIPVIVWKKPTLLRNSSCFKCLSPRWYVSTTLCARRSVRPAAAVPENLTAPLKEEAMGQSSGVFCSLGGGETCAAHPTDNVFVTECFRVWLQCVDTWIGLFVPSDLKNTCETSTQCLLLFWESGTIPAVFSTSHLC